MERFRMQPGSRAKRHGYLFKKRVPNRGMPRCLHNNRASSRNDGLPPQNSNSRETGLAYHLLIHFLICFISSREEHGNAAADIYRRRSLSALANAASSLALVAICGKSFSSFSPFQMLQKKLGDTLTRKLFEAETVS